MKKIKQLYQNKIINIIMKKLKIQNKLTTLKNIDKPLI